MNLFSSLYADIKYLQIAAFIFLLAGLYVRGLCKIYPYFTVYVWVTLVRLIALAVAPYGRNLYGWIYFLSEPITWIACGIAILEVYSKVLKNYPGIATLGRKALVGSMGGSILLAFGTLLLDFHD